jgi:hypothetical protein
MEIVLKPVILDTYLLSPERYSTSPDEDSPVPEPQLGDPNAGASPLVQ